MGCVSKRGELTFQEIVLLILALVVLIAMLYIFRGQMNIFVDKLFGLSDSVDLNTTVSTLVE